MFVCKLCFFVPLSISALQDNEIAQGIQEELIRQAEQQRQQEEKDAVRDTNSLTKTKMSANSSTMLLMSHL